LTLKKKYAILNFRKLKNGCGLRQEPESCR